MGNLAGIVEITEGTTRLLVPKCSIEDKVPPKEPAFFNPRAKLTRDISILAYSSFIKNFKGPKIFLDGFSSIGPRGLRVANEIRGFERVVLNDVNPSSLDLAKKSADINGVRIEISENETCRFLSGFARREMRASVVDIDPFGSPAKYIDCAIRAIMHGGLLSVTATDLQVLNGLFDDACRRRYGGVPLRVSYGNEIAIRLVLGCITTIADRFDIQVVPLFVESDMHYYRVYVKILNRADKESRMGFVAHCSQCGHRKPTREHEKTCEYCNSKIELGGPLWIEGLFDKSFVESMAKEIPNFVVDKRCQKILETSNLESCLPPLYYTLDEIASKKKESPPKLSVLIEDLIKRGFVASPTSFNPTGFRTNATIRDLLS